MGCDGGTIPKRDELVRKKKKSEQKDKDAELAAKWRHCAISQQQLQPPIVACQLGRLYNKDAVIEFLLDRSKFEERSNFDHIRSLKDIKELRFTDNPAFKKIDDTKEDSDIGCHISPYICPITGLEMNGRYKFCYLLTCLCVFSERAMRELRMEACHNCEKPFTSDEVIVINGTKDEIAELRRAMEERRSRAKSSKKTASKRRCPESDNGASTSSTSNAEGGAIEDEGVSAKVIRTDSEIVVAGTISSKEITVVDQKKVASTSHVKATTNGTPLTNSAGIAGPEKKKQKSIQNNPEYSKAFKSLFNTCDAAKNQQKAHWVTYNPQYN